MGLEECSAIGSTRASDRMGAIGFLQEGHLFGREFDVERRDSLFEVADFGGPDDGSNYTRFVKDPREGDLRGGHSLVSGDLLDPLEDERIGGFSVPLVHEGVALGPD